MSFPRQNRHRPNTASRVEATKIAVAGAHDTQGDAARPGLIQHGENVKGDVIAAFSYLIGGHGEDRQALFKVAQQNNQRQQDRAASQKGS